MKIMLRYIGQKFEIDQELPFEKLIIDDDVCQALEVFQHAVAIKFMCTSLLF